jgi:hypothetical protein
LKDFRTILPLLACCLFATPLIRAQESGNISLTVTYVTSRQVYFDAGTEAGVTVGDTVVLSRSGQGMGDAVITAVASHSSVGRMLNPQAGIKNGDRGTITRDTKGKELQTHIPEVVIGSNNAIPPASNETPVTRETENILSGRVGLQFTGEWADDSRLNVAQPAAVANLHVANLLGTGMTFSLYGREYSELTDAYARYGDSVRSRFDIYQFQLERDRREDWYGFSAGRMVSRYVSGLGTFDGGQVFLRQGAFTTGVLAGKGVRGRALGTGGDETKTAVFAGYRMEDQPLRYYEASIAYARQTVHGNLDRSFVYLQGSTSLGPQVSMFGNAEVDLNEMRDGQRVSATRLSSAMLYVNYFPQRWLSASLGYDGTRSVYLFETMKNIPDSLINESIRHGLHARVTVRPISSIILTGTASFGTRKGDTRDTRTISGGVRFLDIFGSGIHAGARYNGIVNVYLDGTDISYELERFFLSKVSLLLRYDHYSYSVAGNGHSYLTQTMSANISWYITRSWYCSGRGSYIIDDTMNSFGAFVEVGVRF